MGFARIGSEFLVNTTTPSYQHEISSAVMADGRFLLTWTNSGGFGADVQHSAIVGQFLNADGSKSGSEFLVNEPAILTQQYSTVTALADGRFVVTWSDQSEAYADASDWGIRGQVFNADGSKSGAEFQANTTTVGDQRFSNVTAQADGSFVVTWVDYSATGGDVSGSAVRGQRLSADGVPIGAEFLVNTTTADSQFGGASTALVDGGFVVAWADRSATSGGVNDSDIRAQRFNADGSVEGSEFLVNSTTNGSHSTARAATLSDGRFVVTWSEIASNDSSVRARVFNADGSAVGLDFMVNTTTTGSQYTSSVVALPDGRFVIAWDDISETGGDLDGSSIRAQVFAADGSKSGTEFVVNTTTVSYQQHANLSALADGRFMVAWEDTSETGGDISGVAVRAQIFDATVYDGDATGETVTGGDFDDSHNGYGGDDILSGMGGRDLLNGGDNADTLRGGDDDDRLNGGASFDLLFGDAGNDRLDGGVGVDQMAGGLGDDVFYVDNALDQTVEASNAGTDRVYFSVNGTLAANIENGDLTGSANLTLTGNALSNVLRGNTGANTFQGGGGADQMIGGRGDDTYHLDSTSDSVVELAGQGYDTVFTNNHFAIGSQDIEAVTLTGSLSRNLTGNALNNILTGNGGSNVLDGGPGGADTLIGGAGNDTYHINSTSDVITELAGGGTDTVFTSVTYSLDGKEIEHGTLTGTGNINLVGSSASNVLVGNGAGNTMVGAGGADTLTGGAGIDKFDFNAVSDTAWSTYDTITDLANTDVIDLATIDANTLIAGNQAFVKVAAFTNQAGQIRLVYSSASNATYVQGDVDGDGVGDFRIRLSGDHRDFDNFAL